MNRFFMLACALFGLLFPRVAFAANDTFTCDAFAEYHSDANGTRAVIRRQWQQVTYKISPLVPEGGRNKGSEVSALVFYSGDSKLDERYRHTAPAFRGTMTLPTILDWMAKQPHNTVIEEARSKGVVVSTEVWRRQPGPLRAQSVCWRNGDTPPDRSTWPGQQWTCEGAVYYRLMYESGDIGQSLEKTHVMSGLSGPETAAQSVLRARLIEFARNDAARFAGGPERFVLDTQGGSMEATPIKCWTGTKPGAPVDWRGPTSW